jgi:hypothetical protein
LEDEVLDLVDFVLGRSDVEFHDGSGVFVLVTGTLLLLLVAVEGGNVDVDVNHLEADLVFDGGDENFIIMGNE